MELEETHCCTDVGYRKEKVEAALARPQSIKRKVSELRLQLEALGELQSEIKGKLYCVITVARQYEKVKKSRLKALLEKSKGLTTKAVLTQFCPLN